MTNEERIELLKAVAECAPKEMKATFREEGTYSETECVLFMGCEQSPLYLHLHPEWTDGEESFAMLDAMEKAGYKWELAPYWLSGRYRCIAGGLYGYGHSKAEAIARAFIQVFVEAKE